MSRRVVVVVVVMVVVVTIRLPSLCTSEHWVGEDRSPHSLYNMQKRKTSTLLGARARRVQHSPLGWAPPVCGCGGAPRLCSFVVVGLVAAHCCFVRSVGLYYLRCLGLVDDAGLAVHPPVAWGSYVGGSARVAPAAAQTSETLL